MSNYTFTIEQDEFYESPFEWEEVFTLAYQKNSRYVLGNEALESEEMNEIAKNKEYFVLPVFAYIHSEIALSLGSFSCPFDSGQSGFLYASKKALLAAYGRKRISKKLAERIHDWASSLLKGFQAYVNGEAYFVTIFDENGEEVDACGGFLGEESAQEFIRQYVKD